MGDSLPRDSRPITETSPLSRSLKAPFSQTSTMGRFLAAVGNFKTWNVLRKGKHAKLPL